MSKDPWLPRGHELFEGLRIRTLQFSGPDWQIFDTDDVDNVLLVRPELAQKWIDGHFLDDSLLGMLKFGSKHFRFMICSGRYAIAPVENAGSPTSKEDAIAFSLALKATRELSPEVSFHDALYVEQYSRLLPTWTLTPQVDDATVLGTWITGGVFISTNSFRRLTALTGWMPPGDLAEIVTAAGFTVPGDANLLAKGRPSFRRENAGRVKRTDKLTESATQSRVGEHLAHECFCLPGRPELEAFFNEHIIDIIFNAEKYLALGIGFPAALVLHGPPGCGKTFAVERLIEFIDWPSYSIDSNSVGSPYIPETSKKISGVFDAAIEGAPSILVIDEMESYLSHRQSDGTSSLHHVEEVAEFLKRIPEAVNNKVLVIAMTNLLNMIDPAILRRGRFDHVIEVGMPTRDEVSALLDSLLSKLPTTNDLDLENLLDALAGKALSDSAFVIREASRLAAKAGKSQLDQDSLEAALQSLPKATERRGRRIGFVREE